PRRRLVDTQELLPALTYAPMLGRRLWFHPRTAPVRGWILQQMAKIALAARLDRTAVMIVDSDVELIRPVTEDLFLREGRARLYSKPGVAQLSTHFPWHRTASRLLGLPVRRYLGSDHIAQIIIWSPQVVRALIAHLEDDSGGEWYLRIGRNLQFSEYILYGAFCELIPGEHQTLIFADSQDYCHTIWTPEEYATYSDGYAFGRAARSHHVGMCIQSNLGLAPAERAAFRDAALAGLPSVRAAPEVEAM
ncbi:MAG: DUF6492 family protein, partial [Caulobacterales bacterium]|nr:DUF6492 family protein [Caulobacterales bacterium]